MTWWHRNPASRVFWDNPRTSEIAARFRPLAALFVLYRVNASYVSVNPWRPRSIWWRLKSLWYCMNVYHWGKDFKS